uniref:Putative secreted protein n=1 Tax=Ixodes ricinus TaxID=34613 RepID=A0A6B0V6B2_IXORI
MHQAVWFYKALCLLFGSCCAGMQYTVQKRDVPGKACMSKTQARPSVGCLCLPPRLGAAAAVCASGGLGLLHSCTGWLVDHAAATDGRPNWGMWLPGSDWLGDLGHVSSPGQVLLPDCLLDAIHLILVALSVAHGTLLRFFQSSFQSLDSLHRCSQALFQLRQFAAQVGVVTHQLLVDLGKLVQVVLEEGDLLLLGQAAPRGILRVLSGRGLLHPALQVLHKELAQVVQRLQLLGHRLLQALQVLAGLLTPGIQEL